MVLGAQWGDEGKGKLVDMLSQEYDVCARVAGGSNAGHTIVAEGTKYKFHLVPSGILNKKAVCVVGNGVVIHLKSFLKELQGLEEAGVDIAGRIKISDRAHIVFDFHQEVSCSRCVAYTFSDLRDCQGKRINSAASSNNNVYKYPTYQVDGFQETRLGRNKIGTTKKGIGPAYASKISRNGLRVGDLNDWEYFESRFRTLASDMMRSFPGLEIDVESELAYYKLIRAQISSMTVDTIEYTNSAHRDGKKILVEGANATMLDIDFGTYPYVTSSNPSIGSVLTGLGVSPMKIRGVLGVVKAYCTRVGEGPFPTEDTGADGEFLQKNGFEFGTTTGRHRRCGWLDIPQMKYSTLINGYTSLNLTKLDVLTGMERIKIGTQYIHDGKALDTMPANLKVMGDVKVKYEEMPGWTEDISKVTKFEDLPQNAKNYVLRVQELLGVPIRWIGVGPNRLDVVDRGENWSLKR